MSIIEKARRVTFSCRTREQAQSALRYLDLVEQAYPDADVCRFKKELITVFALGQV